MCASFPIGCGEEKAENARRAAVTLTALERAWTALAATLTAYSLLAVGLARAGLFHGWALLAIGLLACGIGWVVLRTLKPLRRRSLRREALFLTVILLAGLLLFSWPAEHFPQMGDSSIYPNTAAMLIRSGGLTYHYDPLDGLTLPQKQLFYVPSDRQLPHIQIQAYEGLLYGAYYIMDSSQNMIVSSRPPLLITWMGLFGMLFGERGMLYVTPLFGAASLLAVYFLGKRVFDASTGALAAVWLMMSFPQLHFSRTPYAEVVGQFFVLTALYALVAYWQIGLSQSRLASEFSRRSVIARFSLTHLRHSLYKQRDLSLRRAQRGSNLRLPITGDCFASLAMTGGGRLLRPTPLRFASGTSLPNRWQDCASGRFARNNTPPDFALHWQMRRLTYVPLGIAALAAAFAARIDALIALPTLLFFVALLAMRWDWKALVTSVTVIAAATAFTLWTANQPYLRATGEILLAGQLRFLSQLDARVMLVLGGLLGLVLLLLLRRQRHAVCLPRSVRWGLSLAVLLAIGYVLHIRPQSPEYVLVNGELFPTYNEEVMAAAAQYLSPPFFWLAAFGIAIVLWQRRIPYERILLLVFVTSFAGTFFWKYTSARVYPVALRRLLPEVLPGMSLLGAFALRWLGRWSRMRWAAIGMAGLVTALLMSVAAPYWFYRGAVGTWDFLDTLADHLPPDAVVLFEPRQEGSIAGWFAAPLWSFHQRQALLLNSGELDGPALRSAMCYWQSQGKSIYVVSQRDPSDWWPGDFRGYPESEAVWKSSIVGQSRRFPPYVWHFAFSFSIYRLETI